MTRGFIYTLILIVAVLEIPCLGQAQNFRRDAYIFYSTNPGGSLRLGALDLDQNLVADIGNVRAWNGLQMGTIGGVDPLLNRAYIQTPTGCVGVDLSDGRVLDSLNGFPMGEFSHFHYNPGTNRFFFIRRDSLFRSFGVSVDALTKQAYPEVPLPFRTYVNQGHGVDPFTNHLVMLGITAPSAQVDFARVDIETGIIISRYMPLQASANFCFAAQDLAAGKFYTLQLDPNLPPNNLSFLNDATGQVDTVGAVASDGTVVTGACFEPRTRSFVHATRGGIRVIPVDYPRQHRLLASTPQQRNVFYFFPNLQSQLPTRLSNGMLIAPVHSVDAWLLNGMAIPNSATRTWAATQPGTYTYRIRTAQGQTLTSQPMQVTITDLEGVATVTFSYTNPAAGTLALQGVPAGAEVRLHNAAGQLVLRQQLQNTEARLDVSALIPGLYALTVAGKTHKLLIAK